MIILNPVDEIYDTVDMLLYRILDRIYSNI